MRSFNYKVVISGPNTPTERQTLKLRALLDELIRAGEGTTAAGYDHINKLTAQEALNNIWYHVQSMLIQEREDYMNRAFRICPYDYREESIDIPIYGAKTAKRLENVLEQEALLNANKKCQELQEKLNNLRISYNILAGELGDTMEKRAIVQTEVFKPRHELEACAQFLTVTTIEITHTLNKIESIKKRCNIDQYVSDKKKHIETKMLEINELFAQGMKL